jgi:hypothetical protein
MNVNWSSEETYPSTFTENYLALQETCIDKAAGLFHAESGGYIPQVKLV